MNALAARVALAVLLTACGSDGNPTGVTDPEAAVDALRQAGLVVRREPGAPPGTLAVDPAGAGPARITQVLGERGLWLSELTPVRPDLEQVFLDLTSDHTLGTPGDERGTGGPDGDPS